MVRAVLHTNEITLVHSSMYVQYIKVKKKIEFRNRVGNTNVGVIY